jgi:hypothetical protein
VFRTSVIRNHPQHHIMNPLAAANITRAGTSGGRVVGMAPLPARFFSEALILGLFAAILTGILSRRKQERRSQNLHQKETCRQFSATGQ